MRRISASIIAAAFVIAATNAGAQPIPVIFIADDTQDDHWEEASTAIFDAHVAENVPLVMGAIPCANGSTMADDGSVDCMEPVDSPPFHETLVQWATDNPGFFEVVQHGATHARSPNGSEIRDFDMATQLQILSTGLDRMATWGLPAGQPVTFSPPFAAGNQDTVDVSGDLQFSAYFQASATSSLVSEDLTIFTHPVFMCEAMNDGPDCTFKSSSALVTEVKNQAQSLSLPAIVVIYHVQDVLLSVEPNDPNRDMVDPDKVAALRAILSAFKGEEDSDSMDLTTFQNIVAPGGGPTHGSTTPGLYDPVNGGFFLRNANSTGPADMTFSFGPTSSTLLPIRGDWDGDGDVTIGLYDPAAGALFMRNQNADGPADETFFFGPGGGGLVPLTGDWDGNGTFTIGLYDPSSGAFFLRNTHANGPADETFFFGPGGGGLVPLTGDWNGNGMHTVGLYDPASGATFLRNAHSNGPADQTFFFGSGGNDLEPLAGDWDGDGTSTIGLRATSTSTFFLRNTNSNGPADMTFGYGPAGAEWMPVTGDWNGS